METRIYMKLVGMTNEDARLLPVRFVSIGGSEQHVEVSEAGRWRKMQDGERIIEPPKMPQIASDWVS